MALKGLDIFKLTPKTNCKECGNPTCMAFSMKVAQGAVSIDKCPHMSAEALATLSEATAPPMKTISIGAGEAAHKLGGETVLFRHDKTFVSKNLFAVNVCAGCYDAVIGDIVKVDYERISERMYVELLNVKYSGDKDAYVELVKKAMGNARTLILECDCVEAAEAALAVCADAKPVLNGANAGNLAAMVELAKKYGVVLGVTGANIDEMYDNVAAAEAAGYKDLVIDVQAQQSRRHLQTLFRFAVQL